MTSATFPPKSRPPHLFVILIVNAWTNAFWVTEEKVSVALIRNDFPNDSSSVYGNRKENEYPCNLKIK